MSSLGAYANRFNNRAQRQNHHILRKISLSETPTSMDIFYDKDAASERNNYFTALPTN